MQLDVCVVGGGPAGMMAGLLFARAGLRVVVLEKHQDFLRDFRGDTVHPSTLDLLAELGLADQLATLPHRDVTSVEGTFADGTFRLADFTRLPGPHRYIRLVPQWDLLELLATHAGQYPAFTLLRSHGVHELVREGGRVCGVVASDPTGLRTTIRSRIVIAADGRHSTVRQLLGLPLVDYGAPMDVLWFRVSRRDTDGAGLQAWVGTGRMFVCIDRGDYWQIAGIIPKGGRDRVVADGLPAFQAALATLVPALADRVTEVADWDRVKTLTVQVNRLRSWHRDGALLIGDAAHAMSPVGGVGINLAVQDAVATARLLAPKLHAGGVTDADLDAVRRRRWLPTAGTQLGQRLFQRTVLGRILGARGPMPAPAAIRMISRSARMQAVAARLIGVGLRPEHLDPPPPTP